jgi:hypothetical protein
MKFAASIYQGGNLIAAAESDYSSSRELGLICPFCKDTVFLVKEHLRGSSQVAAAWRHYKLSPTSCYCENRSLSKEGKVELKLLGKSAQNQRLNLFNRRFWEIFKYQKDIPLHLKQTAVYFIGSEETLQKMVLHCHERWNAGQILEILPDAIKKLTKNPLLRKAIEEHPATHGADTEAIDILLTNFHESNFTVLRYKILYEVVGWLASKTALDSFAKLIYLSLLDCVEISAFPIHSSQIAEMALTNLIWTNWEKAIASLDAPSKGIGFCRR